ncbi:MAG: GIY-YIG nuclease family protein [Pseudomonadota bacterium]
MSGWVYILASKRNGTLYIGVTSDLQKRIWEHKNGVKSGFPAKYGCRSLVWFEHHPNIVLAIKREKSLKDFKRLWKLELIEKLNPDWADLTDQMFDIDNPYQPKPSHPNYDDYH